ncbi:MAG TPA: LCP family protein [Mycobacteriales bacterium]|nr:LCP family protein [Mycobacteriales bacterium]
MTSPGDPPASGDDSSNSPRRQFWGADPPPVVGGQAPLPETYSSHPRPRWARIVRWAAGIVGVLLLVVAAGVVADYFYIKSKITTQQYTLPTGASQPPKLVAKAQNFVLIGSDTRAGANGSGTGGAKIAGARSDTTMILHISAGNSGATLVSIPRDSYVQIPSCVVGPNGQTSAPEMNKFNAAYSIGGEYNNKYAASCTVHTIETLTGLHIDHYAVVDFIGFQKMVEALGGVRMCVSQPLVDPVVNDGGGNYHGSGLNLPAGKHVQINGQQALALMRARYALDGGGDLPRIKRQQQFAAAMVRKATSSGLLIDPLKLQHFLVAAASSLTTDGFGLGTMRTLASALHSVGAGGVHLLTVPNLTDQPGLPYGDVEWDPSKAPELWTDLKHDRPLPGTTPSPTPTPTPTPTTTPTGPPLTVAPSGVYVAVQNGTAQQGLAHTVATQLQAEGFRIVSIGDADRDTYHRTTIRYGSQKVQSSQTLAAAFEGSKRVLDPTLGTTITLIVGDDFTQVLPVTVTGTTTPTPTPTPTFTSISAAEPGCLS